MRRVLVNVAISVVSLLVFALFCELVVFRFVLVGSDIPENGFDAGVVKYLPNQAGVFRLRDEIAAAFRINRQGWNSAHPDFPLARTPGKRRIAVVGDSYVEGLHVDFDRSLAEQLERRLGAGFEVFRFGISGAPLSQYVQMFRQEVIRYEPELVIFVLTHNDLDESFRRQPGRYTSSFLKLRVEKGAVIEEILPEPYRRTWIDAVRQTATMRYLYYRQQVSLPNLKRGVLSLIAPKERVEPTTEFQANVEIGRVRTELHDIEVATDYLFCRIVEIAKEHQVGVLLVMDGVRAAIYAGQDDAALYRDGALRLNALAKVAAGRYAVPFIDLHGVFARDYERHARRFEFRSDQHWNPYAHQVVAEHLGRYIGRGRFLPPSATGRCGARAASE